EQSGTASYPASTNSAGQAIFTSLGEGKWTFRTYVPQVGSSVPKVIQSSASEVALSNQAPAQSTQLKIVPMKHSAANSEEPIDIRDAVSLASKLTAHAWDFDQNGVSDRNDIHYLLQLIGNQYAYLGAL